MSPSLIKTHSSSKFNRKLLKNKRIIQAGAAFTHLRKHINLFIKHVS